MLSFSGGHSLLVFTCKCPDRGNLWQGSWVISESHSATSSSASQLAEPQGCLEDREHKKPHKNFARQNVQTERDMMKKDAENLGTMLLGGWEKNLQKYQEWVHKNKTKQNWELHQTSLFLLSVPVNWHRTTADRLTRSLLHPICI